MARPYGLCFAQSRRTWPTVWTIPAWSRFRPRREHATLIQAARDAASDGQLQQEIQQTATG
jgi:hypothetical protein